MVLIEPWAILKRNSNQLFLILPVLGIIWSTVPIINSSILTVPLLRLLMTLSLSYKWGNQGGDFIGLVWGHPARKWWSQSWQPAVQPWGPVICSLRAHFVVASVLSCHHCPGSGSWESHQGQAHKGRGWPHLRFWVLFSFLRSLEGWLWPLNKEAFALIAFPPRYEHIQWLCQCSAFPNSRVLWLKTQKCH